MATYPSLPQKAVPGLVVWTHKPSGRNASSGLSADGTRDVKTMRRGRDASARAGRGWPGCGALRWHWRKLPQIPVAMIAAPLKDSGKRGLLLGRTVRIRASEQGTHRWWCEHWLASYSPAERQAWWEEQCHADVTTSGRDMTAFVRLVAARTDRLVRPAVRVCRFMAE